MVAPHIEYWDTGRVAREKINGIIDEVNASIPSIGDNGHWYIWGVDTGIMAAGYTIRPGENLIKETANREIYTDLQFADNLTTTSSFPIGVTVGNVSIENGRPKNGILLNAKTSTSYCRWLYGSDGNLYFDGWNGIFKTIPTAEDVNTAIQNLRNQLAEVAFTGKSSDLDNDAEFSVVKVTSYEEDGREINEEVNE